ncbi:hypothetical protein, partial [Falsiroseomonas oryzae]|uniref:hypothetical protein n=1 Tax=Falsiroseomonas oryzae TaxID=2766473 RepID=UPI0022EB62F1
MTHVFHPPGRTQPAGRVAGLAGLVVLGAMPQTRRRLSGWGARCPPGHGLAALHRALDLPGVTALCWLPPGQLPIRPLDAMAALLLDGADHAGALAAEGWCLTAATARAALR